MDTCSEMKELEEVSEEMKKGDWVEWNQVGIEFSSLPSRFYAILFIVFTKFNPFREESNG
jgi:hypothetical protein